MGERVVMGVAHATGARRLPDGADGSMPEAPFCRGLTGAGTPPNKIVRPLYYRAAWRVVVPHTSCGSRACGLWR
jgi:hypothetical protein